MNTPGTPSKEYEIIGKPLPRADARAKVTGSALYLEDLRLPGMLYGKALLSKHAHARILGIDTSEAEQVPGVYGVVTGANLPFLHGEAMHDKPYLAREVVRYKGEAVAAIAAVDEETAERALELIRVEYEELTPVFDPLQAFQPGAPQLHPNVDTYHRLAGVQPIKDRNVCNHFQLVRGNVEEGFSQADRIFENTFTTPMHQHCCIEPHMAICQVNQGNELTLWVNNDSPYRLRQEIATSLKVPMNDVRIIGAPAIGGNFGGKGGLKAEAVAIALAWKIRNRPVRVVYTRDEVFGSTIGRHPSVVRIKTGVKNDGTIVAQQVEFFLDTGAYAEKGPTVTRFCGVSAAGPYKIPNVRVDGYCMYTNKVMSGAFRGYGGVQACWAYESQMDIMAHALGIDPLAMRLHQVYEEGDEHITGQRLNSHGLKECLERTAAAMEWNKPLPEGRGRGIACFERAVKTPFGSAAFVRVNEDGTVDVLSSTTDVGQGSETILRQIAAEELGVPFEQVKKVAPDTAFTPYDASTTSSRSTFHSGNAVKMAAADAREQIIDLAAPLLKAPRECVQIKDGEVFAGEMPENRLTLGALMNRLYGPCGTVLGRGYYFPSMPETAAEYYSRFMVFWLLGATGAEVNVDRATGEVKVLKVWSAHDIGKVINPLNFQGQIEGGVLTGLGFALSEGVQFKDGEPINASFLGYKVPTIFETPEIVPIMVEHPHPEGPYGAKGGGETTDVPVPPAIANAIYDAVGVRIRNLPITPDKVLQALQEQARTQKKQPLTAVKETA